jgi:hypothetical protein
MTFLLFFCIRLRSSPFNDPFVITAIFIFSSGYTHPYGIAQIFSMPVSTKSIAKLSTGSSYELSEVVLIRSNLTSEKL